MISKNFSKNKRGILKLNRGGILCRIQKLRLKQREKRQVFLQKYSLVEKKIKGVRSIRYENNYMSQIPTVTLELNALDVTIDSPIAGCNLESLGDLKEIVFKDGEKVEFE